MATATTFSYAQAAKGQGSSAPSSATANSQEPVSSASQTNPIAEKSNEPIEVVQNGHAYTAVAEKQDSANNNGTETEHQSEGVRGTRDASSHDEAGRLDRPWRQADKGTRSSSTTTRSVDEQDARRQRKSKKPKGSEKTPTEPITDKEEEPVPEPPKVELSEAPIPSVNIWQQRKEAQLAKVKPTLTATTTPTAEPAANNLSNGATAAKPSEDAATPTPREPVAVNGTKPHRKPADASRPERNATRGSKLAEREVREGRTETPPLVSDAAAWPTPETAIKEEKKKPSDKLDRSEKEKDVADDGAQSKPRQKEKWVTYDYVPSVSFETQLPQLRGSKARSSPRTPNTRGANATTGEKAATSSTQQTKTSEVRERPRETAAGPSRSTMSPPTTKRTPETSHIREQKKQPATHVVTERPKETAPASSSLQEHTPAVRERPEGRNDRGRGGYRGRGGHHSVNSHHQQHVGAGFGSTGPMAPRPQGPYSPPNRQVGHGQVYMPQQRGGGRGRGNGNFHRMSLPNGAPRVPTVQAHFRPYEYPMLISAMPFQPQPQPQPQHQPQPQPYWDNVAVPLLKSQIEYYFSIENLCKDMYLRARMDSQGFVPLPFIAAFKRVRDLSADIGFIRAVCEMSTEIDFVIGDDEVERIRRKEGWEKFVLPFEDRDEFARNHGPVRMTFKNRGFHLPPQYNGMTAAYGMASPPAYPIPGDISYQQMRDESTLNHHYAGHSNGYVAGHGVTSQLSADVPDFSPSGSIPFSPHPNGIAAVAAAANPLVVDGSSTGLTNGVHGQPDEAGLYQP